MMRSDGIKKRPGGTAILLAFVLFLFFPAAAYAQERTAAAAETDGMVHIYDEAGLLSGSESEQLEQMNVQFRKAVSQLSDSEASLAQMWEGEAQKAFRTAFNQDREQFEAFAQGIDKYVQALREAVSQYESAENKNVGIAK